MGLLEMVVVGAIVLAIVIGAVGWIGADASRYRTVARLATGLAFVVVVVGAFVRLTDAGLGCPDWPGCYGDITPATAKVHIDAQEQVNPFGPVTMAKAWKEMIHRYIASALGSIIIALMIASWRVRRTAPALPKLAIALLGVVLLQGAFGAWTVTLLLKPAIVTGHLIGGMLTLSLLLLLSLVASPRPATRDAGAVSALRPFALAALIVVAMQIVLGGWTSTNYAALACADYPTCQGAVVPKMNFADAFHIVRNLGGAADGSPVTIEMLTAIHWTHRSFAYVVIAVIVAFALRLRRVAEMRGYSTALFAAIGAQVFFGIANVIWSLPLPIAVAHNAGAAVLLLLMVAINTRIRGARADGRSATTHARTMLHATLRA